MKKAPLVLFGLLLIAGGIGYFSTWSAYQDWQKAGQQLDSVAKELDNLKDRRTLLSQLEAAQPTLGQQANLAEQLIPTEENREAFISEIDGLATTNAIKIQTLTFSAATNNKKASDDEEGEKTTSKKTASKNKTVDFRVTTTGPYLESIRFLDALERASRYVSLSSVDMAPGNENEVSLSVGGRIYIKPAPKASNSTKFDPTVWNYLTERRTRISPTPPPGNRNSPFGNGN